MNSPVSVAGVRTLLARAYAGDPLIRWIFSGVDEPDHAAAAWLGLFVESYVQTGHVDVVEADGRPAGVALWRVPATGGPAVAGRATAAPSASLPSFGGLLAALVGAGRARTIGESLHAMAALRPAEPHVYLHFMAVDPQRQRGGVGSDLLRRGLAAAAGRGLMVHLETTSAEAVRFYQAHGFTITGEIVLPAGGPALWGMRLPTPP